MNWRSNYRLPLSFILFFVLTFFLLGEQLPALPTYLLEPGSGEGGPSKLHILDLALGDGLLHRPFAYLIIGTVGPHSFDFQIMDTKNPDRTIINPQNIDPWTSVTDDTFDYVSDSLRNDLPAKNIRTKEPLGGKVGYDKDETMII